MRLGRSWIVRSLLCIKLPLISRTATSTWPPIVQSHNNRKEDSYNIIHTNSFTQFGNSRGLYPSWLTSLKKENSNLLKGQGNTPRYLPGDHLGVLPVNDENDVNFIMKNLQLPKDYKNTLFQLKEFSNEEGIYTRPEKWPCFEQFLK